jgi:hypothetical protein
MTEPGPSKRSSTPDRQNQLMVRLDEDSKTYLVQAADEQLAFWNALNETPKLTEAQQRLGATMRGER